MPRRSVPVASPGGDHAERCHASAGRRSISGYPRDRPRRAAGSFFVAVALFTLAAALIAAAAAFPEFFASSFSLLGPGMP